jgi:signal transduction histidine kinase
MSRTNLDDTLHAVAGMVVPMIADGCRIDLVHPGGGLVTAIVLHREPELTQRASELCAEWRRSSDPVGSASVTAELLVGHAESPRARFTDEVGMIATLGVPLVVRGRTIGVLSAYFDKTSSRTLTPETQLVIEELATRAALAIDNAMLLAELEQARRVATAASQARDRLLAMLGHELRNPLAPIVTALELLDLRGVGQQPLEFDMIRRQVTRMVRLVDDLLDVSRLASEEIALARELTNVGAVIMGAVEAGRPAFKARGVAVELDLGTATVFVDGDPMRLGQIVGNLLANAAKFSPPGERITIGMVASSHEVEISIQDRGSGIAPELLPHIFDPFVQAPQPLAREQGGLGLGLAIVSYLVALHDGRVTADSEGVGRGSTFRVYLPRATSPSSGRRGRMAKGTP